MLQHTTEDRCTPTIPRKSLDAPTGRDFTAGGSVSSRGQCGTRWSLRERNLAHPVVWFVEQGEGPSLKTEGRESGLLPGYVPGEKSGNQNGSPEVLLERGPSKKPPALSTRLDIGQASKIHTTASLVGQRLTQGRCQTWAQKLRGREFNYLIGCTWPVIDRPRTGEPTLAVRQKFPVS